MTITKLSDHANLPDDPRECCRAILDALGNIMEYPHADTPAALAELVATVADAPDGFERAGVALNTLAYYARKDAEAMATAIERIHTLARHGTCDHREIDRRIAEGLPAFSGPTMGEVRAAQKVLEAYGDDASEEAALKVLASMEGDDAEAAS